MNDRYKQIEIIDNRYWNEKCPVVLERGALYFDVKEKKNFLQLKFSRKIDEKRKICGFKIIIDEYDIGNKKIAETVFQFIDINDQNEFGSDKPVYLGSDYSRSYDFTVKEIVFADGTIEENGFNLLCIENQECIDKLGEYTYIIRKKLSKARFLPIDNENYWVCVCGEVNGISSSQCTRCKALKEKCFQYSNMDFLREEHSRIKREDEEKEQKKHDAIVRKAKRIIPIVCVSSIVLILLVFFVVKPAIIKSYARKCLDEKNYAEAVECCKRLNIDSDEYLLEYASSLINAGKYQECDLLLEYVDRDRKASFRNEYSQQYCDYLLSLINDNKTYEYRKSIELYGETVKHEFIENNYKAIIDKGIQNIESGNTETGKNLFMLIEAGMPLDQIESDCLFNMGLCLLNAREKEEAERYFDSIDKEDFHQYEELLFEEGIKVALSKSNYYIYGKEYFDLIEDQKGFCERNRQEIVDRFVEINDIRLLEIIEDYFGDYIDKDVVDEKYYDLAKNTIASFDVDKIAELKWLYNRIVNDRMRNDINESIISKGIEMYNDNDYSAAEKLFNGWSCDQASNYLSAISFKSESLMSYEELKAINENADVLALLSALDVAKIQYALEVHNKMQGAFKDRTTYFLIKGNSIYIGEETFAVAGALEYDLNNSVWETNLFSSSDDVTYDSSRDELKVRGSAYVRIGVGNLPNSFNQYK